MPEFDQSTLESYWGRPSEQHYYVSLPFNVTGVGPQPLVEFLEKGYIAEDKIEGVSGIVLSTSIKEPADLQFNHVASNSPRIILCLIANQQQDIKTPLSNETKRVKAFDPSASGSEKSGESKYTGTYTSVNVTNQTEVISVSSLRAIVVENVQVNVGAEVTNLLLAKQKHVAEHFTNDLKIDPFKDTIVVSRLDWDLYSLKDGYYDLLAAKTMRKQLGLGALDELDTTTLQEGFEGLVSGSFFNNDVKAICDSFLGDFFIKSGEVVSNDVLKLEEHLLNEIGELPEKAGYIHEVASVIATDERIESVNFKTEFGSQLKAVSVELAVLKYALQHEYHFNGTLANVKKMIEHLEIEVNACARFAVAKKMALDLLIDREALRVNREIEIKQNEVERILVSGVPVRLVERVNGWTIVNSEYDQLFGKITREATRIAKPQMIKNILNLSKVIKEKYPYYEHPLTFRVITESMLQNLSDMTLRFIQACLMSTQKELRILTA